MNSAGVDMQNMAYCTCMNTCLRCSNKVMCNKVACTQTGSGSSNTHCSLTGTTGTCRKGQKSKSAYLAPATSKMGALKLVRRKRPDVDVAMATSSHLSHSYGSIQINEIGTKILSA